MERFQTTRKKASNFKIGDYISIHGYPAKVTQASNYSVQPGNLLILGIDIFTGAEYEIICPPSQILKELVVIKEHYEDENEVIEIHLEQQ